MRLLSSLFDYSLPEHLIAQHPVDRRDQSRLLVVHRAQGQLEHRCFADLPDYLRAGDLLVRNTASVLPARLRCQRPSGGAVECFLLRWVCSPQQGEEQWQCLLRPGKRLPVGASFSGYGGAFRAEVLAKDAEGGALVAFTLAKPGDSLAEVAGREGEVPLPPYIQRASRDPMFIEDKKRYQTIYADPQRLVAVAAPTAGLHFTPELLTTLSQVGVASVDVVLHVGLGTFRPIVCEYINDHPMHTESYEIPLATRQALNFATKGRRIAVGTTAVRSVEDYLAKNKGLADSDFLGTTALFLRPPCTFAGVDALITNFHQPRSTLLCLVAAFLSPGTTEGIDWLKAIYAEAIARNYRFFSYGDAMLVL